MEKHATKPFILGYRIAHEESSLENGLRIIFESSLKKDTLKKLSMMS
ncbi:hypothetical protein F4694_000973 [Bacillus niacini]|uniref:Uncharacterized protein n=1 Tax=Neobacillus niacini TaxID=86668 RepID=A0A852T8R2_9BACI|nr:hypothetical protein [Neobacillus niacini]NYE04229.1 hypothetical protein [Neobacillus niacini]